MTISSASGDPVGFPQDVPGAHGTSDDRVTAFMSGYLAGFIGCEFMGSPGNTTTTRSPLVPSEPDLVTLLPLRHEVPSDLGHTGDQDRSLTDVAVNYTNPAETARLFTSWGWEGNVTRSYEGPGWSSGITSVYVSIHRFGSAEDSVKAMNYSAEDQMASTGAWVIFVSPLASTSRALATSSDVTIYAQQGDVMIRLTVAASSGDPMPTAESIMQSILARVG